METKPLKTASLSGIDLTDIKIGDAYTLRLAISTQ